MDGNLTEGNVSAARPVRFEKAQILNIHQLVHRQPVDSLSI
jgi:hypothetical protein